LITSFIKNNTVNKLSVFVMPTFCWSYLPYHSFDHEGDFLFVCV